MSRLRTRIRAFLAFLYDFVIGDDATIAAVVVVALGATALVAGAHVAAWWILPFAVVAILTVSVLRASR
jgi:hypothetical protein